MANVRSEAVLGRRILSRTGRVLITESSRLSRVTGNFSKWVAKEVYPSILMLRCLALRQRDPSNWEKLMEFKFCGNPNWKNEFQSNSDSDAMKLVNQWVPESVNIQETLHKLCTFFFINSYELSEDEDQFVSAKF